MWLKAPEGVGAVGFDGQTYKVVDGVVEVPNEATCFLEQGFIHGTAPDTKKKVVEDKAEGAPKAVPSKAPVPVKKD